MCYLVQSILPLIGTEKWRGNVTSYLGHHRLARQHDEESSPGSRTAMHECGSYTSREYSGSQLILGKMHPGQEARAD